MVHDSTMLYSAPLLEGILVQRYKRFLADVALSDGTIITAHCANPGSMLGLAAPGNRVYLSKSDNPARKLGYSWEIVEASPDGGLTQLIGINSSLPNRLVGEALAAKKLAPFAVYDGIRAEVKYGTASRVDFLLTAEGQKPCYLEIKNCHMMRIAGRAEFPDSVTKRGTRHLHELTEMVKSGARAALVYIVQMQAQEFDIARDIDPAYDAAFRAALAAGVESYAYICEITAAGISIGRSIPIVTPR